jgi:hypothetical protein
MLRRLSLFCMIYFDYELRITRLRDYGHFRELNLVIRNLVIHNFSFLKPLIFIRFLQRLYA